MKQGKTRRIPWIDMVKGICMMFVLLTHIEFTPSVYRSFFAPFFLTLFFVASGYTFHAGNSFGAFFVKKVKTLLIPLFSLALLGILLTQVLSFGERQSFKQQLLDLVLQDGTGGYRLWFVAAMFVASLMFYPLSKWKAPWMLGTVTLLLLINYGFKRFICDAYLPWHLNMMGAALFWMGIGYALKNYVPQLLEKGKSPLCLLLLGIGYVLLLAAADKLFGLDYVGVTNFALNLPLYLLLNAVGSAAVLMAAMQMPQFKLVQFVGRHTLFYFAFHGKAQSLLLVVLKKAGLSVLCETYAMITAPLLVFAEVLLLIVPCILFEKLFPFAVGKGWKQKSSAPGRGV